MIMRAELCSGESLSSLRQRHRDEIKNQLVHDSLPRRPGWTQTYSLHKADAIVGFGSIAVGGPWTGKPTLFEFYVLPEHRTEAFTLFEVFLSASGARFLEVQTNDVLCATMALTYGREFVTEKIVFQDFAITSLPSDGAVFRQITAEEEIRSAMEIRQGGGEWLLEMDGQEVAKGGILFHYNRPYGDIYMEVNEGFRRRGLGSYFVQELKRACYQLGAIPAARCNPENSASRSTLQKAGFLPIAAILTGTIAS